MIVTTLAKWFHDTTKESIGNIMGDGTYNENGIFDPNDPAEDVTDIFAKLDKEYHMFMDKYTPGTGGRSSSDENYVAWQQRNECHVVNYTNQQASLIYLTVVHMWDKMYGFPFVSAKNSLPLECAIDPDFNFDMDDEFGISEVESGINDAGSSGRMCSG